MAMTFKLRRGTAANWTSANPTLAAGEPGIETDTDKLKFGDGTTAWNSLNYFGGPPTGAAGGVLSGTYPNPGFAADMATQAELDAHTGDTTGAHAATAISIVDTGGYFTGTEVEAALQELGAGGGGAGVDSIAKSGSTALTGAVTLSEGANVTLTQVGQTIAIAATAGSAGSACRAYRTTNQSIGGSTETALSFDAEEYDTDAYHDNSTNPSRLTAPATGVYHVGATVQTNGGGLLYLALNGDPSGKRIAMETIDGTNAVASISTDLHLTAGDYVEAYVYSGGGFTVSAIGATANARRPAAWMHKVA